MNKSDAISILRGGYFLLKLPTLYHQTCNHTQLRYNDSLATDGRDVIDVIGDLSLINYKSSPLLSSLFSYTCIVSL